MMTVASAFGASMLFGMCCPEAVSRSLVASSKTRTDGGRVPGQCLVLTLARKTSFVKPVTFRRCCVLESSFRICIFKSIPKLSDLFMVDSLY
jgi:hypothetical protein